jgi:hypothetical protein
MNARTLVLAALALGAAAMANAQSGSEPSTNPAPEGGRHHHRPPPQAIAACDGKKSGDACSFAGRENETVSGTCFSPPPRAAQGGDSAPQERPMACRPNHGGKPGTKTPG